jgi:diguanylate cyclase (GGDEF)-like protein
VEAFQAQRQHTPLTVVVAEADNFNDIGETVGTDAADKVLGAIAASLTEQLPPASLVGLLPDAKYAVVLPGITEARVRQIAERARDHIAGQPIDVEIGGQLFVFRPTVSFGVAGSRRTMTELLAAADSALAEARSGGGNRVGVALTGAQAAAE